MSPVLTQGEWLSTNTACSHRLGYPRLPRPVTPPEEVTSFSVFSHFILPPSLSLWNPNVSCSRQPTLSPNTSSLAACGPTEPGSGSPTARPPARVHQAARGRSLLHALPPESPCRPSLSPSEPLSVRSHFTRLPRSPLQIKDVVTATLMPSGLGVSGRSPRRAAARSGHPPGHCRPWEHRGTRATLPLPF